MGFEDQCTEHDLAWKVLCQVGIAGKVVGQIVPNGLGVGRRTGPGSQKRGPGRALPATEVLNRSVQGEVEDS